MRRLAFLLLLLACSGGSGFSIQPAQAMVPPGEVVQFLALGAAPPVTWSVVEAGGGTVAAGLYTAPACPTVGVFHVQAASGGRTSQAAVTVAEVVSSVSVSPASVNLAPGQTQQFTATITSTCGVSTATSIVTAPKAVQR
jgi:hypothetical protein